MTDRSSKDFNPKHRVVGAIVLVAVAVTVLPLILDRGPDPAPVDADGMVENQVFVADLTRNDPSAAPSTDLPPAPRAATPAPTTAAVATPKAPAPTVVSGSKVSGPAPGVTPAPKPAPAPAAATDKGYYVQVGTFSSEANATSLADRLKRHGYRVQLEPVRLATGAAVRVRVGPYAQDSQAQAARGAIARKLNLQGIVGAY